MTARHQAPAGARPSDPRHDLARRVLRSWHAVEIFQAETVEGDPDPWAAYAQKNFTDSTICNRKPLRGTAAPDRLTAPPTRTDTAPWAPAETGRRLSQASRMSAKSRARDWYLVVIGAMKTAATFEVLHDALSGRARDMVNISPEQGAEWAPEGEPLLRSGRESYIVAAVALIDGEGHLVSEKGYPKISIGSFPWGLGEVLSGSPLAKLADFDIRRLQSMVAERLTVRGALTWGDLFAASEGLAKHCLRDREVIDALWVPCPCAIKIRSTFRPDVKPLTSFLLNDLLAAGRQESAFNASLNRYLSISSPHAPWDALTDRSRLSALVRPDRFPLSRWPGAGLHPLNLLQQAAVNVIADDLKNDGLIAVNGPPGTGKTTLLRDVVAHVGLEQAKTLAAIDAPWRDGALDGVDLLDHVIVVASSNNGAVENISLALPSCEALDPSIWESGQIAGFPQTATRAIQKHLDDTPSTDNNPEPSADQQAWGLAAACLGNAKNREFFFRRAWTDSDWGLRGWFARVGGRDPGDIHAPERLMAVFPPPDGAPMVHILWDEARNAFIDALEHCERVRASLAQASASAATEIEIRGKLTVSEADKSALERDARSAAEALAVAERAVHEKAAIVAAHEADLAVAHSTTRRTWIAWLIGRPAAETPEMLKIRNALAQSRASLGRAEKTREMALDGLSSRKSALAKCDALIRTLTAALQDARRRSGGRSSGVDPNLWSLDHEALFGSVPCDDPAFHRARDALFVAACNLRHAFTVSCADKLSEAINRIWDNKAVRPEDWGLVCTLVPVVSTTFASLSSMFRSVGQAQLGWLLIDEAGQATPQAAVGGIHRARRAVVIGDPLQIEPIASLPDGIVHLLFFLNGVHKDQWRTWSAPQVSAQVLADRSSEIQGHFRLPLGLRQTPGAPAGMRMTGIPLLVHRRCDPAMFQIANRIAYADKMILATRPGESPIRDVLGENAWIDVAASGGRRTHGKWSPQEGDLIIDMMAAVIHRTGRLPDLYVISPFTQSTASLKALILRNSVRLKPRSSQNIKKWVDNHVGTVHTFQGKENEAVILMLGHGSTEWAGSTPNLLNVAVTRAKRVLYIVGDHGRWRDAGVFATAAAIIPRVPENVWRQDRAVQRGSLRYQ